MGLFDTYLIDCPHCNEEIKDQKKPGDMNVFRFGLDPIDDMNFCGYYICRYCNGEFSVELESQPKVIIRKIE